MATKRPIFEVLEDGRSSCLSAMTSVLTRDYLQMIEHAYQNRGGLTGQREKLQSTSAIRIRRRMVEDIQRGAVLPPIVIGIVLSKDLFRKFKTGTITQQKAIIASLDSDRLSIIDGMQRTTALIEAFSTKMPHIDRSTRVEYWIAEDTGSLIYRMLILNTGQVPWNLKRQIEVVFRSLILELKETIKDLDILETDLQRRRSRGGQFQSDDVIELFLVFGARKEKINIKERLADEFTRLDFMEAASRNEFADYYKQTLQELVLLDIEFDRHKTDKIKSNRFSSGKDIFSSQPACVGFVTAIALEIFGRPGVNRGLQDQKNRLTKISKNLAAIRKKISFKENESLEEFLSLQTLSEVTAKTSTNQSVGDTEREFFLKAFQVMIEDGDSLDSLEPCWRSY